MSKKHLTIIVSILVLLASEVTTAFAGPSSASYELKSYSFGAGGTDNNTGSANYKLNGVVGEVESGRPFSANYKMGAGLNYMLNVNVPPAPTLTNPGSTYDRLNVVINQGGNHSDVQFAIGISTDNFVSDKRYVKADGTVGTSLTTADFKTYTNWGGATGTIITALSQNTTYYVRAKARIGNFSETEWGPTSSGTTTSLSSITFSLDSNTINFSDLTPANSFTDSGKTTVTTTSTNAYNGFSVYARETQSLTSPEGFTISDYSSPNSAPSTWSGTGFGYSTTDNNLGGTGGTTRFNNGNNYAGFTQSGPGDIVADDPGPVSGSPISNEQFTIKYQVTGDATTRAGTYRNVILYTIVPTF